MGALTAALMIGQGVVSTIGKNSQAAAQNKIYRENAAAAGTAASIRGSQIFEQFSRETQQISSELKNSSLDTLETVASMGVQSAASGVRGVSSARIANTAVADGLREEASLRDQVEQLRYNAALSARGLDSETQSRINSVQRGEGTSLFKEVAMQGINYGASKILNPAKAGTHQIKIPTT